jgi:hypothetical protein
MSLRVFCLLALLASCSKDANPWARRMTEADRVAWGKLCGGKFEKGDYHDMATYKYDALLNNEALPPAKCDLVWLKRTNRILSLEVVVVFSAPSTAEQIEPYFRLIENELPHDLRQMAREIAWGKTHTRVETKSFGISGGSDEFGGWRLRAIYLPDNEPR